MQTDLLIYVNIYIYVNANRFLRPKKK